jgi:hypothetical protein
MRRGGLADIMAWLVPSFWLSQASGGATAPFVRRKSMPEPQLATRTALIDRAASGLITITIKPEMLETLADVAENIAAVHRLANRPPHPICLDLRAGQPISREVRLAYAKSPLNDVTAALAIVVERRGISWLIGSIMVSLTRGSAPMRLCTTIEDAVAWLRPYARPE